MADPVFRADQHARLRDPHVRPINEMVDRLRNQDDRGWMPYVAPLHGGVNARVLSVLRDPGPMTQDLEGSGCLCIENADPTAKRQCVLFRSVGVTPADVMPWNAYPWYIGRKPRAAELNVGAVVLRDLVDVLPSLRVVLLQGNEAHSVWDRMLRLVPRSSPLRMIERVECIHPSPQALQTPDPQARARRIAGQLAAYKRVGDLLGTV